MNMLVLYFLKEDIISSKREGGEWAIASLPAKYKQLLVECLNQYNGLSKQSTINNDQLTEFAAYMLHEIKQHMNLSHLSSV